MVMCFNIKKGQKHWLLTLLRAFSDQVWRSRPWLGRGSWYNTSGPEGHDEVLEVTVSTSVEVFQSEGVVTQHLEVLDTISIFLLVGEVGMAFTTSLYNGEGGQD